MLIRDPDHPAGPLFLYPRLVYDFALLGHAQRPGDREPLAIYDFARCVTATMHWYDMDEEEATEYVTTQCEGSWLGPSTPLLLHKGLPDDEP